MRHPEWALRQIGDLFRIDAGKTMSAKRSAGQKMRAFLRTSNVLWDAISVEHVDQMPFDDREFEAKRLLPGDLLICEGGEIGRAAVWSGELSDVSFQNHLHRLRPIADIVEPRFYVFFLQSAFTQLGIFEGAGNKTTIPNLSRNRLAALEVPVPPLAEQRRVVDALGLVQQALRKHRAVIETTEALKRATMSELFSKGLQRETQKETEIGLVPESWRVASFSGVREWLQYGTSVRCSLEPAKFPVLRIPNIEPASVNVGELKYCDMPDAEAARYRLHQGDLIFIRTNGVVERLGSCAVYEGDPREALFASYLIRARPKHDIVVPKYAAFFYSSKTGTDMVAGRATPAADGKYNLNTGAIDSLLLPLPPTLEEQRAIVDILDGVDRKIALHRKKHEVLDALFSSLLHKLMTGELRVAELDLGQFNTPSGREAA